MILTNIQNIMFYEEIRIKQGLHYISVCPLRILYNSKFILMATSLGTNTVVVTRVYCIHWKYLTVIEKLENIIFFYDNEKAPEALGQ